MRQMSRGISKGYATDAARLKEINQWYQSVSDQLCIQAQNYLRNISMQATNREISPQEFNRKHKEFQNGEDPIGKARRDLDRQLQKKMRSTLVRVD